MVRVISHIPQVSTKIRSTVCVGNYARLIFPLIVAVIIVILPFAIFEIRIRFAGQGHPLSWSGFHITRVMCDIKSRGQFQKRPKYKKRFKQRIHVYKLTLTEDMFNNSNVEFMPSPYHFCYRKNILPVYKVKYCIQYMYKIFVCGSKNLYCLQKKVFITFFFKLMT